MFLFNEKMSMLCLRLGMSCWIPFRILLNLEVNQITYFYYKHIRLGFHMRCCMGEWAQSTPAGATALFMQWWHERVLENAFDGFTSDLCYYWTTKLLSVLTYFACIFQWQLGHHLSPWFDQETLWWLETQEREFFLNSLYMFLPSTMWQ